MRRSIVALGFAVMLMACAVIAQAPAGPPAGQPGGAPAGAPAGAPGAGRGAGRGGRGPQIISPQIAADGTVTFRYADPNATKITVSGELYGQTATLTKGDNGVWSATIGPLPPDIYAYSFNVDGVTALDPRNPDTKYGYGGFGATSVFEVPGDGPQFYDTKPVPHGQVRIIPYISKTLGVSRTVWVYTPPNYDKGKDFPVVYLLHGAGDVESGWTMIGRANNIMDNLIAEGKAKPMVVVMPLGQTIQSWWTGPAANAVVPPAPAPAAAPAPGGAPGAGPGAGPGGPGGGFGGQSGALQLFGKDLIDDVMPLVESSFKVSKKADDRAIAGLSMGGGQTLNIAFNRPDLFRWVVMMSPAAGPQAEQQYPAIFKDPSGINKQFKLFWIGVGKDDTLVGPGVRALDPVLTKAGIKHTFTIGDGRHEWTVWRHNLNDVAPLLFR
jgi:enterochelin esterase-like enzyme